MINNIKIDFKKIGIFPFNSNSFDYTKIVQRLAASTVIDAPTIYLEQNHTLFSLTGNVKKKSPGNPFGAC